MAGGGSCDHLCKDNRVITTKTGTWAVPKEAEFLMQAILPNALAGEKGWLRGQDGHSGG